MTYREFFAQVTGQPHAPFPYQVRLATEPWPQVLDIPTGLGKTAAVLVAWLWKRLHEDEGTGARLVYCLPMRVLVDQTFAAAEQWCERAAPLFEERRLVPPTAHRLMGGFVDETWERHPERPSVLVGTQDMLLSRALNRGYAMSRYRWPMHFGLLNNDCLWIFDETQLVGVGIETSAQLQAFRDSLGTHRSTRTLWMSATLAADQLSTIDHPEPDDGWRAHGLTDADADQPMVLERTGAKKPIHRLDGISLTKDDEDYVRSFAARVRAEHEARGGLTLVIVNRVSRAQSLFEALRAPSPAGADEVGLVHSRFRRVDRDRETQILQDAGRDRIVVATQAVEAGVDVSARTLFTELAPWPSLVQRFGRCNRYGREDAAIFWLDVDTSDDKSGTALPYGTEELKVARELLERLEQDSGDAGPSSLREIEYTAPRVIRPVLRRRDLLDLFDTTPDLSGNDVDVSRYVRDGTDTDVQLYWRAFDGEPPVEMPSPGADELCRVSIAAARDFLRKLEQTRRKLAGGKPGDRERARHLKAWRWNALDRSWEAVTSTFPGQVLLLHSDCGGYDPRLGWTGDVAREPTPPTAGGEPGEEAFEDALDSDAPSFFEDGRWIRLTDHLAHVRDEAEGLAQRLGLDPTHVAASSVAGLWHDVGKAHPVFQHKLLSPVAEDPSRHPEGDGPWAKSGHRRRAKEQRKHFRHELASALAWLQAGNTSDERFRNLVAYLVASHHGKVRMSIRSLPGESAPEDPNTLFARGVWQGDELLPFDLPGGHRLEGIELDLSVMQIGDGSWLERMLALRDDANLGPFRLALLETVVRIADWRASAKEQEGRYDDA